MTDPPMDAFDARLTDLLAAYGDQAVVSYDAAAIARVATAPRPGMRLGLATALAVRGAAKLLLLAALVAMLAWAAALTVGSSHPAATQTTIVLTASGPEQSYYRVPGGPSFALTIENRSDVTCVPSTGLAEKDSWCHLVSGQALANRCSVAPHSTIVLQPPSVAEGPTDIYFAPSGLDSQQGIRVIVDVVAQP